MSCGSNKSHMPPEKKLKFVHRTVTMTRFIDCDWYTYVLCLELDAVFKEA